MSGARSPRPASGSPSTPSSPARRNGGPCAAGTARTSTMPPTSWSRRSTAGTAARGGVDDHLENGVYSFQYHPELARDPSANDGKGTQDYVRYAINLAERKNFWIASQRELYQRMADYEELRLPGARRRPRGDGGQSDRSAHRRDGGRAAASRSPAYGRAIEELVHVVQDAFVTVPPLAPGRPGHAALRGGGDRGPAAQATEPQGADHPGCPPRSPHGRDPRRGQRVPRPAPRRRERGPRRHLSGTGGRRAGRAT